MAGEEEDDEGDSPPLNGVGVSWPEPPGRASEGPMLARRLRCEAEGGTLSAGREGERRGEERRR